MHIPDGFLSPPVWISTCAVSAGAVGYSLRRVNRSLEERQIPLMGVAGAFIFAAQMVNFPVAGGVSGHLTGGMLAALLLGPHAAAVIMTAILIVQALIFQDGGITALGANILNMGLLGPFLGYGMYRMLRSTLRGPRGALWNTFFSALAAVVAASALTALEIYLSGTASLGPLLAALVGVHLLIGAGEGAITAAALAFLLKVRQDLIHPACRPAPYGGRP